MKIETFDYKDDPEERLIRRLDTAKALDKWEQAERPEPWRETAMLWLKVIALTVALLWAIGAGFTLLAWLARR